MTNTKKKIESIGQKVTRQLKSRTLALMGRIGLSRCKGEEETYDVIHEALLQAWVMGHDDASMMAIRVIEDAAAPIKPLRPKTAKPKAD